jgi:hypothetical protein
MSALPVRYKGTAASSRTGGEDERPARPSGSVASNFKIAEQHGGDVGRAHRQAGMAGFRLFDGVHRQRADRIGHTGMIDARHDEIRLK